MQFMTNKEDWRLTGQEEYLDSAELISVSPKEYIDKKAGNDTLHEHCEFCMSTVCFNSNTKWYTTKDHYRWICQDCYNDFKDRFCWKIINE